jgi:hypothetical protein
MEEEVKIDDLSFPFTNFSKDEFIGRWDSQEYVFPPNSTVKMLGLIPSASPQQIEHIRKKFAYELAMDQFYRSADYKKFDLTPEQSRKEDNIGIPYTEKDYAKYVQMCLEPLPVATAPARATSKKGIQLSVDEKGKPITHVLDDSELLIQGQVVA